LAQAVQVYGAGFSGFVLEVFQSTSPSRLEFNHSIGFEEDYMLFENHDFIKNKSFNVDAKGDNPGNSL
jgi:hypothetical protein